MIDPRDSGRWMGGPASDPMRPQGEVSLPDQIGMQWDAIHAPTMDPRRKKVLDAMLMKMANPSFQHPPAFQPKDPFRYYPQ